MQNKCCNYSCNHSKGWNQEAETSQNQRDLNDVLIQVKENERQGNVTEGFELQIDVSELLILILRLDIRTFILKVLKCVHGTLQEGLAAKLGQDQQQMWQPQE